MMWIALLVIVIVAVVVAVMVPMLRPRQPWLLESEGRDVESLLRAEKERVLRKLKDLDGELEAGSMDEAEHRDLRDSYLNEAALLNRRIELLLGAPEPESPPPTSDRSQAVEGSAHQ